MIFPSHTKNSLKKVKNVIQSLQVIWTNELQYLFVFKNHTMFIWTEDWVGSVPFTRIQELPLSGYVNKRNEVNALTSVF